MIKKRNNLVVEEKKEQSSDFPPQLIDNKIKTYKDEAILILNTLEKTGVFIYDENNFPGMYLKNGKQNNRLPESLKTIFIKKNNVINTEQINIDDNNQNNQLNNLFQHFKK